MKRTCKKCGVEKDIERFVKHSECNHGHTHTCLVCNRKYQNTRNNILENKEKNRLYHLKPEVKARQRKYSSSEHGKRLARERYKNKKPIYEHKCNFCGTIFKSKFKIQKNCSRKCVTDSKIGIKKPKYLMDIMRKSWFEKGRVPINKQNLIGKKFGKLIVTGEKEERDNGGRVYWICRCDCGNTTAVTTSKLNNRHTRSCGCIRTTFLNKFKDYTGKRFGRLTAIKRSKRIGNQGQIMWWVQCDCGKIKEVLSNQLSTGLESCGCLLDDFYKSLRIYPEEAYNKHKGNRGSMYLSDSYIKNTLYYDSETRPKDIPQSLVNYKREQLKLHRAAKEQES